MYWDRKPRQFHWQSLICPLPSKVVDKANLRPGLGMDMSWLPKGTGARGGAGGAGFCRGVVTRACAFSVSCFTTWSVILLTADSRADMSTTSSEISVKAVATDIINSVAKPCRSSSVMRKAPGGSQGCCRNCDGGVGETGMGDERRLCVGTCSIGSGGDGSVGSCN